MRVTRGKHNTTSKNVSNEMVTIIKVWEAVANKWYVMLQKCVPIRTVTRVLQKKFETAGRKKWTDYDNILQLFFRIIRKITSLACSYDFYEICTKVMLWRHKYEVVSKSFRTVCLERELQMVQLSATRCSCIAILCVSLVSFAAITLCVASQRVFIVVSVYFVIDLVRKLMDTPSYVQCI
jgi:hypothetical protein